MKSLLFVDVQVHFCGCFCVEELSSFVRIVSCGRMRPCFAVALDCMFVCLCFTARVLVFVM